MPHPRGYGNNARVLGEYVRDAQGDHARRGGAEDDVAAGRALQVHRRAAGSLAGNAADIVIFDAATVADTATFDKPHAYPRGIPHVIVNGVASGAGTGSTTAAKPGVPVTLTGGAR